MLSDSDKEEQKIMEKNSGKTIPKRPIRIIPDANVFFGDPFLRGVIVQTIITAVKFIDIGLVFSEITIDELRNLLMERLNTVAKQLNRAITEAESLRLNTGLNVLGLGYKSKEAMKTWEERWARLTEISPILPYPTVDVKELVNSSISQRRPFTEGDKGLRDYLLWSSILTAARADDYTYILVTNDNEFYRPKSKDIHPDLEQELESYGLSGRVLIRRSFSSVVGEFVKPHLNPEQNVEVVVRSGGLPDFTDKDDSVAIALYEYLLKEEIPEEWITKPDYYSASVDVVEDAAMTDLTSALELDGYVLVTSEWEACVVIDLSCPGYQDDSETVIVSFTVESFVNSQTLEVESHEISSCELCGWYHEGQRVPY
jgi:hypothetical protein